MDCLLKTTEHRLPATGAAGQPSPDTGTSRSLPIAHGLIVWDAEGEAKEYEFRAARILLGRSRNCQIRLQCEFLSSYHLEFVRCDSGYEVRDLDSSNGTKVNGAKCQHHLLRDGDRLLIGGRVVAHYLMVPEVSATPERPLREQQLDLAMIQYLDLSRRMHALELKLQVESSPDQSELTPSEPAKLRLEHFLRRLEKLESAVAAPPDRHPVPTTEGLYS